MGKTQLCLIAFCELLNGRGNFSYGSEISDLFTVPLQSLPTYYPAYLRHSANTTAVSPVFFHQNKPVGLSPDQLCNKDILCWF